MNQNIGQQGSLVNDTCSASSDSDAFRFWRTDLGLSFLRLLFRTSAWVRSSSDFSDDPTPVGSSEEGSGGRHLYVFTLICKVIQMDTAERNKNKLLEISYRVKACSDVTSTSKTGSFSLVSLMASEMPGIGANKYLDIS